MVWRLCRQTIHIFNFLELFMKVLVLVLGRGKVLHAGQFGAQAGGFVDQHRQALRADVFVGSPVSQVQQGGLVFGLFTIHAGVHKSLWVYKVPLYMPPSTVSITPVM
jgi:hypothetical protein